MIRRIGRGWVGVAALLTPLAALGPASAAAKPPTGLFMADEDLPVFVGVALAAAFLWCAPAIEALVRRPLAGLAAAPAVRVLARRPRLTVPVLAAAVALVAWLGAGLVFGGHALSEDEFKAEFDAVILAHGTLMAQVAPAWRAYVAALEPQFTVHSAGARFWASSYLPINGALRAVGRLAGAERLVSPLLAAAAVIATFVAGRRLWPARPELAVVAAVLLATSSQVLLTAMTPYAMTAHMAFDMVWLCLFLRGGRLGHAGAITIGFFATGLHQLAFHPLFVAPFVLWLLIERRWRLGTLYILAYAAICAFWMDYGQVALWSVGGARATGYYGAGGGSRFVAQALAQLAAFRMSDIGVMGDNLVRFVTWQNLIVPPLLALGAAAAWRAGGALRALLLGVILTVAAMFVVSPHQGYGWGYRYLAGLLGSVCLLAAWTWGRLTENLDGDEARAAGGLLAVATALSVLVLLPLRAWQAHAFVRPYAAAAAAIRASPSQVVLVDPAGAWFTADLVRNDPFLRRTPKVLDIEALTRAQAADLCARYTVAVFDTHDARAFGIRGRPGWRLAQGPDGAVALWLAASCGRPAAPVGEIVPPGAGGG